MMLRFQEISSDTDPILLDWLDAIQINFPPNEQVLSSFYFRILRERGEKKDVASKYRFYAILDSEDQLIGAVMYQMYIPTHICYLWYIVVTNKSMRGQGLGTLMFREVVSKASLDIPNLQAIVFEVERPDVATDEEHRVEAERRIHFYQRLGASVARNIEYYQSVDRPDQEPVLMYLCLYPLVSLSAEEKRTVLEEVFEESIVKYPPEVDWE